MLQFSLVAKLHLLQSTVPRRERGTVRKGYHFPRGHFFFFFFFFGSQSLRAGGGWKDFKWKEVFWQLISKTTNDVQISLREVSVDRPGSTQIKEKVPHFLREKKIICRSEKVGIFLEHPIERNQNNKFPAIYRTETHQRIHK